MRSLAATLLLGSLAAQTHTHGDIVGSVDDSSAIVWMKAADEILEKVGRERANLDRSATA